MFIKPIVIIGAPRSGTSLLQKLVRNHPDFVSLPKESNVIWDRFCHQRTWESDVFNGDNASEDMIEAIRIEFTNYVIPNYVLRPIDQCFNLMRYRRIPVFFSLGRNAYQALAFARRWLPKSSKLSRLVEKNIAHSFRISLVDRVFPDAKYIYLKRDGRATINSMINGWRDPKRFFRHHKVLLSIPGYEQKRWNFVFPTGWQKYTDKPLEEVVAFQWVSIHEAIRSEFEKEKYRGRVLGIKLEELVTYPQRVLPLLSEFIEVPWGAYFQNLKNNIPVVNSHDGNTSPDKWKMQNLEMIQRIEPKILKTMQRLGYDMD